MYKTHKQINIYILFSKLKKVHYLKSSKKEKCKYTLLTAKLIQYQHVPRIIFFKYKAGLITIFVNDSNEKHMA